MREAFVVGQPTTAALRAINYPRELQSLSKTRKGHFRAAPLRSLLANFGDSYWSVFTRLDCAREHGVELISQTDMFAAEPEGRVIRRDSMPKPEHHEVSRWQVLIAGAGQMGEGNLFGRSIIADARLVGRFLGPHAVGLTFEDPGGQENLWTYAFLNTGAGLRAVKSCAFGTSVPGLRLDLLGDLSIPIPENKELIARVAGLVREAVEQRECYLRELRSARAVLEVLPEMRDAHAMCSERRSRAVSWDGPLPTLMGWTYASHGGAIAFLRRSWRPSIATALTQNGAFYGLLRQRTPCDPGRGVPLISQRDAHAIRQLPVWIARPPVANHALFSAPNSLVMAGRGTLGEGELFARPAFITPALSSFALTQDLLRLIPQPEQSAVLHAFLSSLVGRRLLRSCAVGTKIMQMRVDLVLSLPYPELSKDIADRLREHHSRSVAAYDTATQAEAEAIRIIEEEVLPAWLD